MTAINRPTYDLYGLRGGEIAIVEEGQAFS